MLTPSAHLSRGSARHLALAGLVVCTVAVLALLAPAPRQAAGSSLAGYSWPVEPFDSQHPVRGSFGDPRTVFASPPTHAGLYAGSGAFSFHPGVDVWAPDGTAVYPVVAAGKHVEARETVLGSIIRGTHHVHLTELLHHEPVNPLAPGHLTPYEDHTRPWIASISFRSSELGADEMGNFVRGPLVMIAAAYDKPTLPIPGGWHDLPVTPSLVTWRLQTIAGKVAVPEQTAADFRSAVPANRSFWSYYARGSFQNMSVFGKHFSYAQPGSYLFKLTREAFDTRRVPDGVYDLVVTATDIRGNSSSLTRRLTVHNRPGWAGV